MVTVVDEENGYLGVSYIQLTPVLIEAIKEQQKIIEQLKKEIAVRSKAAENLETRLAKLETLILE
jgi:uncharacterized protein (DUF3084 family)